MQVRQYEERDFEQLRRIHAAQGFAYPFPDLSNPLFLTKLVLLSKESGREEPEELELCPDGSRSRERIVGAALLRLTAEAYLLLDPQAGTPRQRWNWLLGLQAVAERDAQQRGLEDVHAWLPPQIVAKFGKRLTQLGWVRDDEWTPYCRRFET